MNHPMTEPAKADDLVRDAEWWKCAYENCGEQAADTITALRAQLAKAEADGREATRLLVLWSETDKAEDAEPGHDTFAFLGKERRHDKQGRDSGVGGCNPIARRQEAKNQRS